MSAKRTLLVSTLTLGGAVFAWWLGEDASAPFGGLLNLALLMIILIALAIVLFLTLGRERRFASIVCCMVAAIGWTLGFWGGSGSSGGAFNECVAVGEEVRERLAAYRSSHGTFPKTLSELPGRIPCQRLLRGSLLEYAPQGKDAYNLLFQDWLMIHKATEKDAFLAVK